MILTKLNVNIRFRFGKYLMQACLGISIYGKITGGLLFVGEAVAMRICLFITTIFLSRSRDCQLRAVCEFYREQAGEAGSTGGLVRMVVDTLMGEAEAGDVETVTRDWVRAATRGKMGGECDQLCRDQE